MTTWQEVEHDPDVVKVLDHGFVRKVNHMGSDSAIVQAARVSYGSGTKSVREDRGLIRYLMRHKHTSPFEMCDVVIHLKCPIFVMRQLVRHRTSSLNEYSGRYSVMTDEFYVPEVENIKPQSDINKQGRAGSISESEGLLIQNLLRSSSTESYKLYEELLADNDDSPGIARELARTVLPLSNYTELYWKQNLKNLMHMLGLRLDSHAQWEIQEFARAIYSIVEPLFPLAFEAFEDYQQGALSLSRMEKELMLDITSSKNLTTGDSAYSFTKTPAQYLKHAIEDVGSLKVFAESRGMSLREINEFISTWNLAA